MDITYWPQTHAGLFAPDHFKRVTCNSTQELFAEFLACKRAKHRMFALNDLYAWSIGFVDYDGEKWVLIKVNKVKKSTDERPEQATAEQWDIFQTYIRSRPGRAKLFGPEPSSAPNRLDELAGEPKVEVLEVLADP